MRPTLTPGKDSTWSSQEDRTEVSCPRALTGAVRLDGRAIVDRLAQIATGHPTAVPRLLLTGCRRPGPVPPPGRTTPSLSPSRSARRTPVAYAAQARRMPPSRPLLLLLTALGCLTLWSAAQPAAAMPDQALRAPAALSAPASGGLVAAPAHVRTIPLAPLEAAPAEGVWPLDPRPEVVRGFDPPSSTYGAGHCGVDLAGHLGQEVRTSLEGQVSFVGRIAGRGIVVVSHGATRTTYEPVSASVGRGDHVDAGEVIGTLQWSGSHCLPRACLHWGLRAGDTYLDPLTLVGGPKPVRLLPW